MEHSQPQVLIAANPKSGSSSGRAKVQALRSVLEHADFKVTICESLDELQALSHSLTNLQQLKCVVAAGGDGTAAAVVNRIPASIPMVIFPLGTENLLARHLKMTTDPHRTLDLIKCGKQITLDVGRAGGKLFLVMLSCGFDAEVVHQLHAARKGHISRWTYSKPIWNAIRTYSYPVIQVEVYNQRPAQADEDRLVDHSVRRENANRHQAEAQQADQHRSAELTVQSYSAAWLFSFNLPRYAANLNFCPQADGSDGLLDICSFAHGGTWSGFYYLFQLWLARHHRLKDFRHTRASRFRLTSEVPVAYQIDGDPGGHLPLEIDVLPDRLRLLIDN